MSNTMTAHEPLKYLDSILNEEERRCEYSHEWRNFTISRSGRFKSKNKKRDAVDRKLFDSSSENALPAKSKEDPIRTTSNTYNDQDKMKSRQPPASSSKDYKAYQQPQTTTNTKIRDKASNYKSFYETNL